MAIGFVTGDAFTPEAEPWVAVGPVVSVGADNGAFLLTLRDPGLAIRLSVLSPTCLRVRFDPRPDVDRRRAGPRTRWSIAGWGRWRSQVVENSAERLVVDAGAMRFEVDLRDYALAHLPRHPADLRRPAGPRPRLPAGPARHRQHQDPAGQRRLLRLRREGRRRGC